MTPEHLKRISQSFPDIYEEFELDLSISRTELNTLVKEDERHVLWFFLLDSIVHMCRHGLCVFKIAITQNKDVVTLGKVKANRVEYNGDIKRDVVYILKTMEIILGREDLYVHPAYETEVVRSIIRDYDPDKKCIKSIGHGDNVGLIIRIRDMSDSDKRFNTTTGWYELRQELIKRDKTETLLSLYFQNNEKGISDTFYFDHDGTQLLGQIHTQNIA